MNILITGASGFIGSKLLKKIEESHFFSSDQIILLSSKKITGYLCIDHKQYTFNKDDFLSQGINRIDVLIHLGAFIPKDNTQSNNIDSSYSNIKNTLHLLNNIPNIPDKIIFTSTIDVYKNTQDTIDEDTITEPMSLYGWSKLMCEKIIENYGYQNNSIVQVLRIGHIYGKGEEAYKKLIPISINNIIQNKPPIIYSHKDEKKSYLHVEDCCECIIRSTILNEYKGPINVVSDKQITIYNLLDLLIRISGNNINISITEPKHVKRDLTFSNEKMKKYLCEENINLYEGLKQEYHYLKNLSRM